MMRLRHTQSGSTLIISLVLLVMLTLFVLTVINTTNVNSRIAGNMQVQTEAQAAAQQAIEQTISTNFTTNPLAAAIAVDINNDTKTDYTANVDKPACIGIIPIKQVELDYKNPLDQPCFGSGAAGSSGIVGVGSGGDSLCATSNWDVKAGVTDASSGANVAIHQGVQVRVVVGTSC